MLKHNLTKLKKEAEEEDFIRKESRVEIGGILSIMEDGNYHIPLSLQAAE